MRAEEYHQIKVGQKLSFRGRIYTVTEVELVYDPAHRKRLPYTVTLHTGQNLKPQDRLVQEIEVLG